ncbi:PEP-CTERM sorting domain-containing protein [Pirellulimonas nuda]|uniref:PEP-CTERM sorting domain-containing protein n=1 Tax=Pirellulimonas nuda TaxID=2528009 RepID=UPI001E466EA7|nr:PEP-CTERM sorting domain-containing protein [Pirellulimonas nuda]
MLYIGDQVNGLPVDQSDPNTAIIGNYHGLLTDTLGLTVTYDTQAAQLTVAAVEAWAGAYDLVIFGNRPDGSGPFNNAALRTAVDATTVPILSHHTFAVRADRFRWFEQTHANALLMATTVRTEASESRLRADIDQDVRDALFQGITLDNDGTDDYFDFLGSVPERVVLGANPAGDFNADNTVNAADYTVWRDNVGNPTGTLMNDTTDPVLTPTIGPEQYTLWSGNFGLSGFTVAAESFTGPYAQRPQDNLGPEDPENPGVFLGGTILTTTEIGSNGVNGGAPDNYITSAIWAPGDRLLPTTEDPRVNAGWRMYMSARHFGGNDALVNYTDDGMAYLTNAINLLLNPPMIVDPPIEGSSLGSTVPEPSSLAMVGSCLVLFGLVRYRRVACWRTTRTTG